MPTTTGTMRDFPWEDDDGMKVGPIFQEVRLVIRDDFIRSGLIGFGSGAEVKPDRRRG